MRLPSGAKVLNSLTSGTAFDMVSPTVQSTCLMAAIAKYGARVRSSRDLVVGSWPYLPQGCTVHVQGDGAAYWNSQTGQTANAKAYEWAEKTYTKIGNQRVCSDWVYLKVGGYPPYLPMTDPLYGSDRVKECMKRCLVERPGSTNFYTDQNKRCGCARGACPSLKYQRKRFSYKIEAATTTITAQFPSMGQSEDTTQASCRERAVSQYGQKAVAGQSQLVAGNWANRPKGCSVDSNGNWAIYWNGQGVKRSLTASSLGKLVTNTAGGITEDTCLGAAYVYPVVSFSLWSLWIA